MTSSHSAASAPSRLALIGRGALASSSLGSAPATLSPTGVNPATNHGGRNETAARSPVKSWRRRFRHSTESISGASDHELGSLTRPAHAAVVPGLRRPTAALPSIVHHQHQSTDDTERGPCSLVSCRQYPAADYAQDGSHVRPGGSGYIPTRCLIDDLPVDLGGSLNRCRHFFQFIDQPRRQASADRFESHFQKSPSVSVSMLNTYRNARTTNWVTRTK